MTMNNPNPDDRGPWEDLLRDDIESCDGPRECLSDFHGHCANADCDNPNQEFAPRCWESPYCAECNPNPRPDRALTPAEISQSIMAVLDKAQRDEDPEGLANAHRWAAQVRQNVRHLLD